MAKRNRETLKNYFKQGKRPSEQEFEDLIDSTLNTLDDGFSSSSQIGIGLAPLSEEGVVLSIFQNPGETKAIWDIAIEKNNAGLQIRKHNGEQIVPVITLKQTAESLLDQQEIELHGTLVSKARKGNFKTGTVPADGRWQDIINEDDKLEPGCWAFEVLAGCGERHKGRYALLVATAMHCFGKKRKVKATRSHFGQWGNKIMLRWVKYKGKYDAKLQIKTYFRYGNDVKIQYQITNLWDNPLMQPLDNADKEKR